MYTLATVQGKIYTTHGDMRVELQCTWPDQCRFFTEPTRSTESLPQHFTGISLKHI